MKKLESKLFSIKTSLSYLAFFQKLSKLTMYSEKSELFYRVRLIYQLCIVSCLIASSLLFRARKRLTKPWPDMLGVMEVSDEPKISVSCDKLKLTNN